jgi:hypothetical protein
MIVECFTKPESWLFSPPPLNSDGMVMRLKTKARGSRLQMIFRSRVFAT